MRNQHRKLYSQNWAVHRNRYYQPEKGNTNLLWRQFFDLLPEGMLVTHANGVIAMANPAIASLLGLKHSEQLIGRSIESFIPADYKAIFDSYFEMVSVIPGRHEPVELELWHMDGSRVVVKVGFARSPHFGNSTIQLSVQDVRDQKQIEDQMARATFELEQAYRSTLEGWALALDRRDRETGDHSRNVTNKTVELALAMGVNLEEIVHIRHGALLHDIGKMAIPDAILLKPGPLNDEEWQEMKKHPEIAREMLIPIDYLQPAIEIPYNHHERWDGSGYPRSLKGIEIPFSARIFAVVDVYDALSSDRPYRQRWPEEKVLHYIQENAGTLFDPDVVHVFMEYL